MKTKSKQTALFFSIFTGVLGVDRFYLGYTVSGIIKLLTAGGFGIWALIDFIRIGVDSLRPADGSPWVEETRDENIRSIAANMQTIAERLEKLQAQNVPAEAEKPQTDGENQETHKVSLKNNFLMAITAGLSGAGRLAAFRVGEKSACKLREKPVQ